MKQEAAPVIIIDNYNNNIMEPPVTVQSLQAQAKAETQTTRHRSNVTLPPPQKPVIVVEEEDHDEIPGPEQLLAQNGNHRNYCHADSNATEDSLSLSLTEHYRRGSGILASGKDIFVPPEEFAAGCNLLQAAAMGDLTIMESLLTQNPSHVDFRDYDRRTALHVASSEGHLDVCKYLVDKKGARINRSDRWGGSPLDDAHRHRHSDIVTFLRSKGATTGSADQITNLITAAAEGDVNEVTLLLNICDANKINGGDYDRRTALHLAAGEGNADIVDLLLQAGADPNAQDRWGGRPLDDAMRHGHDECVELLQQHGGQPGKSSTHSNSISKNRLDSSLSNSTRRREQDNLMVDFNDLEMIERIGSGAFGEIYKCRWRGTLVAAKCIKSAKIRRNWLIEQALNRSSRSCDKDLDELDELSQDAKDMAIADFRVETAILRSLRHPNICLLLAYSTTADYEVMISELMKCSLLDVFKANLVQNRRMPRKTQLVYAQQLAQGMNYLHTCKPPVIHRDLKPANLLIDHSGVLKVADFGLAKVRPDPEPGQNDIFVMTGETGSYRFMAPEVYRRDYYDETVDVYSYAMILYYLLSGRPPWPTLAGHKAVAKAADGERPNIPRDWDVRLSRLLQQCWDENPKNRPSFSKILVVLQDYSRDVLRLDPNWLDNSTLEPPMTKASNKCSCAIM